MTTASSIWRSYDSIAQRYDDIWGDHFEEAARHMWTHIPYCAGDAVLDIGTGTGAVPRAIGARISELKVVGCDRSGGMLSQAKTQTPMLGALAAEAEDLPFRQSIFDVVTAGFVMSHLRDYRAGLIEAYRVLKPAGVFAMSSWTAGANPYREAWHRLLTEAVSRERLQEGVNQITPFAGYFEDERHVGTALAEAGFADVQLHVVELKWRLSLEDYLADREITSSGRYAKFILGSGSWAQLLANAREKLRQEFGSWFSYSSGAIIALGYKS
ncbi:hypothetical protein D1AOALGA4SA_9000 [Olavius algarvensis Delta 1 endosymbiont]|nr:hypothetical protein D1AOALGA4SA_9000 [Olavius algarvensis Delta 1 endosymbiont]